MGCLTCNASTHPSRKLITEIEGHYPDIESELYAYFSADHPVRGYILEPQDRKETEILQVYTKNEIIRDVVQRLAQFETMAPRLSSDTDEKMGLARAFADLCGDQIRGRYDRMFLESRSTITYIAKALSTTRLIMRHGRR
jgi:hypothetical protein